MIQAVIRLRGDISLKPDIKRTLHLLRLHKVNHCILIANSPVNDGMLKKIKDYVTWGEVKSEVLARMIVTRGKLAGNKPIDNKVIKDLTKHDSLVKFATAIVDGKEEFTSLKGAKPVFRLHPPLQGHEGIKRSFKAGGALGYRGEEINKLILKMMGPDPKKREKKVKKEPAKPVKAPVKKVPAKKVPVTKKEPAKKTPAKKEPAKKTPAAKTPAKKESKEVK